MFIDSCRAGSGIFMHNKKPFLVSNYRIYRNNTGINSRNTIYGNSIQLTSHLMLRSADSIIFGHASEYISLDTHKFRMNAIGSVIGRV